MIEVGWVTNQVAALPEVAIRSSVSEITSSIAQSMSTVRKYFPDQLDSMTASMLEIVSVIRAKYTYPKFSEGFR